MAGAIIIVCLVFYVLKALLPVCAVSYLAHRAYGAPKDKAREELLWELGKWDVSEDQYYIKELIKEIDRDVRVDHSCTNKK